MVEVNEKTAALVRNIAAQKIRITGPTGSNVPGGDFYTAEVDANGQVTLIANNVKLSRSVNSRHGPPLSSRRGWLNCRPRSPLGRLGLGDPALEDAIRAASAVGCIRIRQTNADYFPTEGAARSLVSADCRSRATLLLNVSCIPRDNGSRCVSTSSPTRHIPARTTKDGPRIVRPERRLVKATRAIRRPITISAPESLDNRIGAAAAALRTSSSGPPPR